MYIIVAEKNRGKAFLICPRVYCQLYTYFH
jgi:hypothetical protein